MEEYMRTMTCIGCGRSYQGIIDTRIKPLIRKINPFSSALSSTGPETWIKYEPARYKYYKPDVIVGWNKKYKELTWEKWKNTPTDDIVSEILLELGFAWLEKAPIQDSGEDVFLCRSCERLADSVERIAPKIITKAKRDSEWRKEAEERRNEAISKLPPEESGWRPIYLWLRNNEGKPCRCVRYSLMPSNMRNHEEIETFILDKADAYSWGDSNTFPHKVERGLEWELLDKQSRWNASVPRIQMPYSDIRSVREFSIHQNTLTYKEGLYDTEEYATLAIDATQVRYWCVVELTPIP
jgi:hypothetical protein